MSVTSTGEIQRIDKYLLKLDHRIEYHDRVAKAAGPISQLLNFIWAGKENQTPDILMALEQIHMNFAEVAKVYPTAKVFQIRA